MRGSSNTVVLSLRRIAQWHRSFKRHYYQRVVGYVVYCHSRYSGERNHHSDGWWDLLHMRSYGIVYIHWDWNPTTYTYASQFSGVQGAEPMELPGLRRKLIGVQRY